MKGLIGVKGFLMRILGLVLTILALLPAYIGVRDMLASVATQNWVKVAATSKSLDYFTEEIESMEGDATGFSHKVSVTYIYEYQGKSYSNNQVAMGYANNSVEPHYDFFSKLEQYPNFYVFVNPNQPSESVIITGALNAHLSLILTSLAMLAVIYGIFVIGIFAKRSKLVFVVFGFLLLSWFALGYLAYNEDVRISLADKVEVIGEPLY